MVQNWYYSPIEETLLRLQARLMERFIIHGTVPRIKQESGLGLVRWAQYSFPLYANRESGLVEALDAYHNGDSIWEYGPPAPHLTTIYGEGRKATIKDHIKVMPLTNQIYERSDDADFDPALTKVLKLAHDLGVVGSKHVLERSQIGITDHNERLLNRLTSEDVSRFMRIYGVDSSRAIHAIKTDSKEYRLMEQDEDTIRVFTEGPAVHGFVFDHREVLDVIADPRVRIANDGSKFEYGNVKIRGAMYETETVEGKEVPVAHIFTLPLQIAREIALIRETLAFARPVTAEARADASCKMFIEDVEAKYGAEEASRILSTSDEEIAAYAKQKSHELKSAANWASFVRTGGKEYLAVPVYWFETMCENGEYILPSKKQLGRAEYAIAASELLNRKASFNVLPTSLQMYHRRLPIDSTSTVSIMSGAFYMSNEDSSHIVTHGYGGNRNGWLEKGMFDLARDINGQLSNVPGFQPIIEANTKQMREIWKRVHGLAPSRPEESIHLIKPNGRRVQARELWERIEHRYYH